MDKSDLIISPIESSPFSYDDVVNLLHNSFDERLKQGLHFTCSYMTVDQFIQRTKNSIVLVSWNKVCTGLLGTITLSLRKDKNSVVYGYIENLAISPLAKKQGLGSLLQNKCVKIILDKGGKYEKSDTAINAFSSVQWHLKNGFKKIALRSFLSTNYYSVVFRKQLVPSLIWDNRIITSIRFFISSLVIKAIYKEDGNLTILGETLKKADKKANTR